MTWHCTWCGEPVDQDSVQTDGAARPAGVCADDGIVYVSGSPAGGDADA